MSYIINDKINPKPLSALYNLGAYDSIASETSTTVTITRQTGYVKATNNEIYDYGTWSTGDITIQFTNKQMADTSLNADGAKVGGFSNNIATRYTNGNSYFYFKSATSIFSSINDFKTFIFGKLIQYQLPSSYTETVLKNRPLNILDQQGSQWLSNEWEKSINLIDIYNNNLQHLDRNTSLNINGTTIIAITSSSGNGLYFPYDFKNGKKYTLSLITNTAILNAALYTTNDTSESGEQTIGTYISTGSYTFTPNGDKKYLRFWLNSSTTYNISNIMLNEGDHSYPYENFNGELARIPYVNKALYHLGAYDSDPVDNNDGTVTITRQTGYLVINAKNIVSIGTAGGSSVKYALTNLVASNVYVDSSSDTIVGKSSIGYDCNGKSNYWVQNKTIGLYQGTSDYPISIGDNSLTSIDQFRALCPIYIEYKLASSYQETVLKNRPLNTLNQAGSNWLMNEWQKGLNLCYQKVLNYDYGSGHKFWILGYYEVGTYTISLTNSTGNIYLRVGTTTLGVIDGSRTFTVTEKSSVCLDAYGETGDIMIVEGNRPCPYQPYRGNIVHEGDAGVLLWENGSPSSSFTGETYLTLPNLYTYKYILFGYAINTSADACVMYQKIEVKYLKYAQIANRIISDTYGRELQFYDNNQIRILNGYKNGSGQDSAIIPRAIYGCNV